MLPRFARRTRLAPPAATILAITATSVLSSPLHAGDTENFIGIDALIDLIGEPNLPTGDGINVVVVEAPEGASYAPDESNPQFINQTIVERSGPSGPSGHATVVGVNFFGTSSAAPGIGVVNSYSVLGFINDLLRFNTASVPGVVPSSSDVMNHSWIGSGGSVAVDNNVMRRADFAAARDQYLVCIGVANGATGQPLMYGQFNAITCGTRANNHAMHDVTSGLDGAGRQRPEIVAPNNATSFATPIVAAIGAMLYETVDTTPELSSNAGARRNETIRAVILAGGDHVDLYDANDIWSNNAPPGGVDRGFADRPIDDESGVGTVRVDRAYMMLTGGEIDGSDDVSTAPLLTGPGWDHLAIPRNEPYSWRISLDETATEISILAAWDRVVPSNFNSWSLADMKMELFRVNKAGDLESMVGNVGFDYYPSGNSASDAPVHNLEHLFIRDLVAGEYVLQLERTDGLSTPTWPVSVAWLVPENDGGPGVPGDANGDGNVDFSDIVTVLGAWGPCGDVCLADLDGDGVVAFSDLLLVLTNF